MLREFWGACCGCGRAVPIAPGLQHILVAHAAIEPGGDVRPCGGGRASKNTQVEPAHALQFQYRNLDDDSIWDLGGGAA